MSIPVSAFDGIEHPGFIEGNPFILKIWKSETNLEYLVEPEIIKGTPTFQKNESTLASLGKYAASGFGSKFVQDEMNLRIYPNPTDGKVYIDYTPPVIPDLTVQVFNSTGQVIIYRKIESEHGVLDLSGNVNGIYYIKITGKFFTKSEKIILR
jgi:hypothetical protein